MVNRSIGSRPAASPVTAFRLTAVFLLVGSLAGCAGTPPNPRDVALQVNENSALRIAWSGAHTSDPVFGFSQVDRRLQPIYDGCVQQGGQPAHVKRVVRFDGTSIQPPPAATPVSFSREVVIEIRCRKEGIIVWAISIDYSSHRFYQNLEREERIELKLAAQYLDPTALRARQRRAEATAATGLNREPVVSPPPPSEEELRRKEEDRKRRQAEADRKQAEILAFRAQLKPGDRVSVPTLDLSYDDGMVVDVKPPLALVQINVRRMMKPDGPSTETRWFRIDLLAPW